MNISTPTAPVSSPRGLATFIPTTDEVQFLSFLRDVRFKSLPGVTLTRGLSAVGVFGKCGDGWWLKVTVDVAGKTHEFLTRKVDAFYIPPTKDELAESMEGGSVPSVLGSDIEVDGFDELGSPSWLKALGYV